MYEASNGSGLTHSILEQNVHRKTVGTCGAQSIFLNLSNGTDVTALQTVLQCFALAAEGLKISMAITVLK